METKYHNNDQRSKNMIKETDILWKTAITTLQFVLHIPESNFNLKKRKVSCIWINKKERISKIWQNIHRFQIRIAMESNLLEK